MPQYTLNVDNFPSLEENYKGEKKCLWSVLTLVMVVIFCNSSIAFSCRNWDSDRLNNQIYGDDPMSHLPKPQCCAKSLCSFLLVAADHPTYLHQWSGMQMHECLRLGLNKDHNDFACMGRDSNMDNVYIYICIHIANLKMSIFCLCQN